MSTLQIFDFLLELISCPKCTWILKSMSSEIQYVMYPLTLFYYSFSQYTTYVNTLKRNEMQIISFSITTIYIHKIYVCVSVASIHLIYHDWMVLKCIVIFIHMYWIWQMTHQHKVSTWVPCHNIYIMVTIETTKCRFKKIAHTIKPLHGDHFIRHLGSTINRQFTPYSCNICTLLLLKGHTDFIYVHTPVLELVRMLIY